MLEEVKGRLVDLQDLLSTGDRKLRIVPDLLAKERGWRARSVGRIMVLENTTSNRRIVASHAEMLDTAYPLRSREARRWLAQPSGSMGGIWFVPPAGLHGKRESASSQRVRIVTAGT